MTYVFVFAGRIDQLHTIDCLLDRRVGVWRVNKIGFNLCKEHQRRWNLVQGSKMPYTLDTQIFETLLRSCQYRCFGSRVFDESWGLGVNGEA